MLYLTTAKYNDRKRNSRAICLWLCLLVLSCNNVQQEETKTEEDSITMVHDIAAEDSALIFENNADKWLNLSLHHNNSSWKKFKLKEFWYEDSMQKKYFKPSPGFYKDYAPLLKWSPDSSYVLDIGTYSKVLIKDKNGSTIIHEGEIDSKASLLFPKADSSAELIFLGASGNFIDGYWLDSTHFSILGTFDEKGDQKPDTLLWVIDAKENFFKKYKLE